MNLPDTTLAWLGALIDGEGSIMLINRSRSRGQGFYWRPQVGIYNTDTRLMEALKDRVGTGSVYAHTRTPKENQKKTSYRWNLNATQIRALLPSVLPWLILKKEQAELLLEACSLIEANKTGRPPEEAVRLRVAEIADTIKHLNRKGRE